MPEMPETRNRGIPDLRSTLEQFFFVPAGDSLSRFLLVMNRAFFDGPLMLVFLLCVLLFYSPIKVNSFND